MVVNIGKIPDSLILFNSRHIQGPQLFPTTNWHMKSNGYKEVMNAEDKVWVVEFQSSYCIICLKDLDYLWELICLVNYS